MRRYLIRGYRLLLFVLACLPAVSVISDAQITSSGYTSVLESGYVVEYPDTVIRDNIYIFCNENGNLSASFHETAGDLIFEWSVYDTIIDGFDTPFKTEQGVESSVDNLESGGYRVRITGGNGPDTLFRAWVFVNRPSAEINEDLINHTCGVLDMSATVDIDTFTYHSPVTGEMLALPGDYDIFWSADPFVPTPNRLDIRVWNPPPVVTEYTFLVNYYLCEASYMITEDPVTTRAEFKIDPSEGEAPLEVFFDAEASLNAAEYEWFFYYQPDTTDINFPDDYSANPEHTYYIPGMYNVMLRTVSEYFCEDFFLYPEPVSVYPSELEVPNVFTPDGDGYNDIFIVRAVSLRDFHGVILNRNGRKVFEWSDPGEGWDGKIGGDNFASPGVYFYIISGEGWDDVPYEFTGPLYLYRGR
ncbi:MAG: gliding motility-associated C-terminal domain-containing protein [Bacteroidales bacterium]